MANDNLRQAKAAKNDEFYTQYDDIAAELKHYSTFLRGKIVFCNCDDPTWSNFWKYLHNNFSVLGLKKLISTHYEPDGSPSYKMEYEGGNDLDTEVGTETPLEGNGDFRSEECVEILCSCDVVITNPPFSLFIDYINLLLKYDKSFIVIGNMNAAHNKDMFPLIRNNVVWCGTNSKEGTRRGNSLLFGVPEGVIPKNPTLYKGAVLDQTAAWWFTNIDIKKRHQPFFPPEDAHCYYEGNEDKYPKYYNFDGIDVAKTEIIPIDYEGYMGVPVSFLDKYNPNDFELCYTGNGWSGIPIDTDYYYKYVKESNPNARPSHLGYWKDGKAHEPFSRIIIRNRHPIAKKDDI